MAPQSRTPVARAPGSPAHPSPSAGGFASPVSARSFGSIAAFTTSVTSASSVSTDASANAAGVLYSWNSFYTRSGIVSVCPPIRPLTTYTAPNSPIARALHRITP